MPFDTAHAIARRIVKTRGRTPRRRISDIIADASRELLGAPIRYTEERVAAILSPRHFVDVRTTSAARRPTRRRRAARGLAAALGADQAWLAEHARRGSTPRPRDLGDGAPRYERDTDSAGRPATPEVDAGDVRRRSSPSKSLVIAALWAFGRYFGSALMSSSTGRVVVVYLVWIVWDGLRRIEGTEQGRRLLPRQPEPAVVGRRPVGDGDADERHHARRHDRPGVRRRPALRAVLLRAADRDGHPVGDRRAVLLPRARLHRVRVPRAALRREDADADEPAVPAVARHVVRRDHRGAGASSCRSCSGGTCTLTVLAHRRCRRRSTRCSAACRRWRGPTSSRWASSSPASLAAVVVLILGLPRRRVARRGAAHRRRDRPAAGASTSRST